MLRCLRGQLAPGERCVTVNPDLKTFCDEFDDYFPRDGQTWAERVEVRRRILDAIGNCSSIEIFQEENFISSRLDSKEWEMVLSPLQNNSSLKKVSLISDCYRDYPKSVELRGRLWGVYEKENKVTVEEKECGITHAAELILYATNLQILKFRGSVWWSCENPVEQLTSSVSNAMRQRLNELEITDVSPGDVDRWWQACSNVIKESMPASTSVNISVSMVDSGGLRTAEPESFRLETKMGSLSPSHSLKIDLRFRSASLGPQDLVTAITKFLDACPPASLQGYVYYQVDNFHEEMRKNKDESYEFLNWVLTHDVVKELCVIVLEREDSHLQ
ncbi:hypothetical protein R1flu_016779 [Riccia fluitans]|uniref:Uncharacterized protein n=1 Tax=Riccia fluitans TaxID=41844 RepID=A0ABD1YNC7_9MARC